MTFSERQGFKLPKTVIQRDSMDNDLRNSLWNVCEICYWRQIKIDGIYIDQSEIALFNSMWLLHFKRPLDELDPLWIRLKDVIKKYFFECKFYEVYDFIEFLNQAKPVKDFEKRCNFFLENELSAFRFVDGNLAEITSKEEINSIEEAIDGTGGIRSANEHLKQALTLFADRKSPDYRNSIKESISAVESLCKRITGDEKATLGEALKKIDAKIEIHPALKGAFNQIYGYSSDEGGIRHGIKGESNVYSEDAKFMLVSCSAFINYLLAKASKAGIKLK